MTYKAKLQFNASLAGTATSRADISIPAGAYLENVPAQIDPANERVSFTHNRYAYTATGMTSLILENAASRRRKNERGPIPAHLHR